MQYLRITLTDAPNREEIIDDLLDAICENADVVAVDILAFDHEWSAKMDMIANAEVFAVLLALSYPEIRAKL